MFNPFGWFKKTEVTLPLTGETVTVRGASKWKINNKNPVRHDCSHGSWGHTCHLEASSRFLIENGPDAGVYFKASGHLYPRVKAGDEVIVPFGKGPVVLQFVAVENVSDPADMYFATLKTLGYLKDLPQTETKNEVSESAKIKLEGRTRESHPDQWARGNGT
ncbi:MAG: hypothetical protein U1E65_28640 [Myxococcota bacterium]